MDVETPSAFFSYSRTDAAFAIRLAEDLKSAGANVWMDQLDIEPGTPWDRAIEAALMRSTRMLVILSPASAASDNVSDEVSYALSKQKRVIPILYRECDVPFRLARLQHIDFRTDYGSGLKSLTRVLGAKPPAPPQNNGAAASIVSEPEIPLTAQAGLIPEEAEKAPPPPAKPAPADQIGPQTEKPGPLEKEPLRVPERIWQQQEEGNGKAWERGEEARNPSGTAGRSMEEDHPSSHQIVSVIQRWGWMKVSVAICLVLLTAVVTIRWLSHQGGDLSEVKQSDPASPQRQAFAPKPDVPQVSAAPAGSQLPQVTPPAKPAVKTTVLSSGSLRDRAKSVTPNEAELPPGMDSTLTSAYQAAQRGDFYNMVLIGDAYRTGKGVAKDCKQAGFWYANATEKANAVQRSWMESDAVQQSWSECKAELTAELMMRLKKSRQELNESVKNLSQ